MVSAGALGAEQHAEGQSGRDGRDDDQPAPDEETQCLLHDSRIGTGPDGLRSVSGVQAVTRPLSTSASASAATGRTSSTDTGRLSSSAIVVNA